MRESRMLAASALLAGPPPPPGEAEGEEAESRSKRSALACSRNDSLRETDRQKEREVRLAVGHRMLIDVCIAGGTSQTYSIYLHTHTYIHLCTCYAMLC